MNQGLKNVLSKKTESENTDIRNPFTKWEGISKNGA